MTRSAMSSKPQPRRSPADVLEAYSAELDILIRDLRLGTRSHREHDRNVDVAERIGAGIIAVFRKPTPPAAAPLLISGNEGWW